jgi:DNA integrity scanning protein DisA with diadenylate cyclase activity
MRINIGYFILFSILLIAELLIGIYIHDAFIRPFGGDFVVVIMIYCFIKSLVDTPAINTAAAVLIFSYTIEISQYFHLAKVLGLQHSRTALLILGNIFSFNDLWCYTLGILLVLFIERIRTGRKLSFN